jgi:hypothetical protein
MGELATIQLVVDAWAVTKAVDCSHWWKVMPRKTSRANYAQSLPFGRENCLVRPTARPRMATPMAKRSHTIVVGAAYRNAILVATKEAPQTVTAKRALRTAFIFILISSNF